MESMREILRQRWWFAVAGACALMGVAVLSGCGSGESTPSEGAEISGAVGEWYVRVDEDTVASGPVTFRIVNSGAIRHEFLIVKTDVAPGTLIVGGDARFSETDPAITVVGEIPEWGSGQQKSITVDFAPGAYQLVCNIAGHYRQGMWAGFTVS